MTGAARYLLACCCAKVRATLCDTFVWQALYKHEVEPEYCTRYKSCERWMLILSTFFRSKLLMWRVSAKNRKIQSVVVSRIARTHKTRHANDSFYWFFPTMLFLSSSNFFIGREQKSNEKERKKLFVTSLTLRQVREIATGATKRHRRNEWKSTKKKEQ